MYEYRCKFCQDPYTVVKSVDRIDIIGMEEICPIHGSVMERQISFRGSVSAGTFKEGYNHALGKTFTTKRQQDDELRRIKHETGKELVEVGNDSGFSRPEPKQYDSTKALHELRGHYARNS